MGVSACGGDDGGGGGGGAAIKGSSLRVYASPPQQGASAGQAKAIENGAKLALEAVGGKVGKYQIQYKPLDDSLASSGQADEGKGAQNARTAAGDKTTIGYIGEYNSGISKGTIPILNKRSEEHTSELQSRQYLVCRLLLEKKKTAHTSHPARRGRVCHPPLRDDASLDWKTTRLNSSHANL